MSPDASDHLVDRVRTPRGELVLRRRDEHYEVISNGVFLMDTRDGRSERLLVTAALDTHPHPQSLLIAGLGVGFSLSQAVADPRLTEITVVEIEPALVGWHAGPLAAHAADALTDPRVELVVADIRDHLATAASYDVICLDVDNGPDWTVSESNSAMYDDHGTQRFVERLSPGGVLAVWSAHAVPDYEARLRKHFVSAEVLSVPVQRGEPDVVYLARSRHAGRVSPVMSSTVGSG